MATKDYESFTVGGPIYVAATTYYDLPASQAETAEHKHYISATPTDVSAQLGGTSEPGQTQYLKFQLKNVPNLASPTSFVFYEGKSEVAKAFGAAPVNVEKHLNESADGTTQLLGQYYGGIFREYKAFYAKTYSAAGSASILDCEVALGGSNILEESSATKCHYDEETRELTFYYIALRNENAVKRNLPYTLQFAGYERWNKTWEQTYVYSLSASSPVTLHLGMATVVDELSLVYDLHATAPLRNGYPWDEGKAIDTYGNVFEKLALSVKPDTLDYIIRYETDYEDSDGNSVVLTYKPKVIGLADNPFSSFQANVTAYEPGNTINLKTLADEVGDWPSAVLTYSDGQYIAVADAELQGGKSITASLTITEDGVEKTITDSLEIKNLKTYSGGKITLTFPFKVFGTLTYTYDIEVSESLAYAVKLSGVKTDFAYGDVLTYGDGAKATLYDNSGKEISVADNSVSALLKQGLLKSDPNIASAQVLASTDDVVLDGATGQGIVTTTLQNANYHKYLIYITYADSFKLSSANLGDVYVDSGVSASLSSLLGGITAKYVYHDNKASGSSEEERSVSSLSFSETSITTASDIANKKITASTSVGKQTLSTEVSLNVYVRKFTGLEVSHKATGNTYYTDRTNTFVIPSDLVIKKVSNDPTKGATTLTSDEMAKVKYRIASGTNSDVLEATTSTIPANQSTIYVTLELGDGTILQGSYDISGDYQADSITAVNFGKSFTYVLGNKPSTFKNSGDAVLVAHYASGYATNLTDDVFTNYYFVQKDGENYTDYEKVVMSSDEKFYVKTGGKYYEVGYESGVSIAYSAPKGTISISGYQQSYVNLADKVDFSEVKAKITYEGANSLANAELSLDKGNVATASTYALSCDGLTAFDGTQTFNLTESGVKVKKVFTVSAKNRFNGESVTATFEVEVLSINNLSFTRLLISNPKTEYKVGETFLNETDATKLTLYYGDEGTSLTMNLKDVSSLVSTDPSQGTAFTKANDSMTVTVRLNSDGTKYTTYTARVSAASYSSTTLTHTLSAVLIANGTATGIESLDSKNHYYYNASGVSVCPGTYILVSSAYTTIAEDGSRVLKSGVDIKSIKKYGYLEDLFNASLSARVILFDDYVAPVSSESNIEVKFPCYVEGNADKINNCHIAKLFGNNNAKNRLFVSGNPDFGNYDWHSSEVNGYVQSGETADANGDFTYFGDMDYCSYGQTDNEVLGYDHVSTDKMIVLLSKSSIEPTNYFRGAGTGVAIDGGGNTVYGVDGASVSAEQFPCYTGNIGSGAMNRNSVINLNGDTLYLSSENTICGLDISGQVGDNQRISYSRSKYIDPELKGLDLSDAVLWSDNRSAFLFSGDGAYMTNYESYSSDTGQYEWWKTDVKGARCAISLDGEIYFGCADGSLYKLDESIYYDCDKVFIEAGGTLYVSLTTLFSEDKIIYSESLNPQIEEGAEYTFTMKPASLQNMLFRKCASLSNAKRANVDVFIDYATNSLQIVALDKNGKFDAERYSVLLEELAYSGNFYLNCRDNASAIEGVTSSSLTEYYRAYKLIPMEDTEDRYSMVDSDGNAVSLATRVTSGGSTSLVGLLTGANLCRPLDGEYEVYDLNKADCSFKLKGNGRALDIVRYGNQSLTSFAFASELHRHSAIKTYWIASPATLSGGVSYRKTLWAYTLTAFKDANDLEMCLATNEESLEAMKTLAFADSVPVGFNLKALSFSQVDFTKDNVPRKYTYFRPVSVPFACFGFRSDKPANSVLTTAQIVYSVPMMGRGNK